MVGRQEIAVKVLAGLHSHQTVEWWGSYFKPTWQVSVPPRRAGHRMRLLASPKVSDPKVSDTGENKRDES